MGTRSDLPRALSGFAVLFALAGCVDFVEPEIPDAGGPALVVATVVVTDTGVIELSGRLLPGLTESGLRRGVSDDALRVEGEPVRPTDVRRDGTRVYGALWADRPPPATGAMRIAGPTVEGVTAAPAIAWYGIRRAGPDTLALLPAAELRLPVRTDLGISQPVPAIRQWFLTITGDSTTFRLGGDGVPPDTIRVPSWWIPAGDELNVRLIYSQSGVLEPPPGDYIANYTLDTRLFWTLRRRAVAAAGGR